MNDLAYILLTVSLFIGVASIVMSSRKSGFIVAYRFPFKRIYAIDGDKLLYFCVGMILIAAGSLIIGLFFSGDILTALVFTALNTLFIGYALVWGRIVRLK